MSTYKGTDNCTDIILDLASEHESQGNYNAVIGDVHAAEDLSVMSIASIYVLMDELLAKGQPSTATGRYQIIRRTMQAIVPICGFTDDTLFTPAVQDRLAVQLLVGRGYASWWRGGMTDAEFAHGMSCEWASMPDPQRGGVSHYAGVGANHAGMSLSHVYERLNAARAAKPTPTLPT